MGRFDGVFLDFYGTLAAGDRHAVETICQAVVDDHALDMAATTLAVQWGRAYFAAIEADNGHGFRPLLRIERDTLVQTLKPLVGRIDVEPYLAMLNAFLARPSLFEEVPEVLGQLRLPVCLVTNADERELRAALDHHALGFAYVVSSESARSYKPAPAIFEAALSLTGWDRQRVIHVGDSLHSDVAGARAVGLQAAWVCRADRISDIGTTRPQRIWPDLRPLVSLAAE